MMQKEAFVARKYARAYLKVFSDELDLKHFQAIEALSSFLAHHKQVLFFLQLRHIDTETKLATLGSVFKQLGIPESFMHLMALLLTDKRAWMLHEVVKQLCILYEELKYVIPITITASHELSSDERTIIDRFIEQKAGCCILAHHKVDPSLIAGLRIQAHTILWEYSVRKQLQLIRNSRNQ